jgi:hypothetical protein
MDKNMDIAICSLLHLHSTKRVIQPYDAGRVSRAKSENLPLLRRFAVLADLSRQASRELISSFKTPKSRRSRSI